MEFVKAVSKAFSSNSKSTETYGQADLEGWGIENVKLRSYQLDGFMWLAERYKNGYGCILGDEMGLGKTLQVYYKLYFLLNLNTALCVYLLFHSDRLP